MPLVADSSDLSLLDLIQVKGASRATCRIAVQADGASGVLFLKSGVIVYATYASLQGEAAAYAILQEPQVEYHVTSDVLVPAANMEVGHQALVLEAVRRLDELAAGGVRQLRPRLPRADPPRKAPLPPRDRDSAAPRADAPESAPAPQTRSWWRWIAFSAAVVAIAIGSTVLVTSMRRAPATPALSAAPPPTPISPAAVAANAIDASALHEGGDRLPVLVSMVRPASPDRDLPVRPTIVCRLLVDSSGAVLDARIYQHREGLGAFEQAALEAVKAYRFEPARRGGAPVPVWINWPVEFRDDVSP